MQDKSGTQLSLFCEDVDSAGHCITPNRPIGGLCQHSKQWDGMANTTAPVASMAQEVTKVLEFMVVLC